MAGEGSNVSIGLEIEPVGGNVFNLLEQQADAFFQKMMGMSKVPIEIPLRVVPDNTSLNSATASLQSELGSRYLSIDVFADARIGGADEAVKELQNHLRSKSVVIKAVLDTSGISLPTSAVYSYQGNQPQGQINPQFISQPRVSGAYSGSRGVGSKRLVDQYGIEIPRVASEAEAKRVAEAMAELAEYNAAVNKPINAGPVAEQFRSEIEKLKAEIAHLTRTKDVVGLESRRFDVTEGMGQYRETIIRGRDRDPETGKPTGEIKELSRVKEEAAIVAANNQILEIKNKIVSADETETKIIRTQTDLMQQLTVAEQKRLLRRSIQEPQKEQEKILASEMGIAKSALREETARVKKEEDVILRDEMNRAKTALKEETARVKKEESEAASKIKKEEDTILRDEMNRSRSALREFIREMKREEDQAERTFERTKRLNVERNKISTFQAQFRSQAMSEGFRESAPNRLYNAKTGDVGKIQQYYKVHHDGLAKWSVTLREFNTLSGIATERIIHGAAAAKFLGDSLYRAGEKVFIWTAATTTLFTFLGVMRSLMRQVKELESNEVLLSRVSDRLVYSVNNAAAALTIKQEIARELTRDITLYTAAIGGSATESQKAATSYLRAGQTQEETLMSVKAALIATHIAEIDVAQAAEFLTSTYLQFNLTAKDLLPTLDSLNTLSNNYKVTTKDLLDSISRTGEVYAEHNGTLEELAAVTAVVSQVTSRTGTQIGNAIKTIQSNLDRPETRKMLFEELGIQSHDAAGEAKSFGRMLIELRTRMLGVSDAEQKQIQLGVSNIRQRSILASATSNVADIMVAENKALMESGSAMREYEENSKTLSVALQRLQGDFSVLANNTRGPIGDLVKEITALLSGLLKVINYFSVIPSFITRGAIFLGLTIAIQKLTTKLFPAASGFMAMSTGLNTVTTTAAPAAAAINTVDMYLGVTAAVAPQAAAGMWTFAGALSAVKNFAIGLFNPLTITIGVLTILASVLLDGLAASNAYSHELENQITLNDQLIASEEKKQKAYRSSAEAILSITDEMIRQNSIQRSGGDPKKALENYEIMLKDMNKIAQSAGYPLFTMPIDLNDLDKNLKEYKDMVVARNTELESESKKRERRRIEQQISITTLDIKQREEEIAGPRDYLERGIQGHRFRMSSRFDKEPSVASKVRGKLDLIELKDLQYLNMLRSIGLQKLDTDNIEEYILKLRELRDHAIESSQTWNKFGSDQEEIIAETFQKEIDFLEERITKYKKQQAELDNTNEKLAEYKDQLEKAGKPLDATSQDKLNKIIKALRDNAHSVNTEMEGIKKKIEIMNNFGIQVPYEEYERAYNVLNKSLEESTKRLNEWRIIETEVSKDYIKGLEEINKKTQENRDEFKKLWDKARFSALLTKFNDDAKTANDLIEGMVVNSAKLKNAELRISGGPAEIGILDDRINHINQQVKKAVDDYNKIQNALLSGRSKDNVLDLAKAENIRSTVQDRLTELKSLELERAKKIRDTETEITLEKKKQTEEALKALGTMDEESKLRLYAMAQYLREHPDTKITLDDLFMADERSAGLMQRYFGKYIESDPAKSKIGKYIGAVDWFGVSQDTYSQYQQMGKYRADMNKEWVDKVVERISDINTQIKIIAGSMSETEKNLRAAFEPTKGLTYEVDKVTNTYHITVGPNAVDIKSLNLGESLKKGIEAGINIAIEEAKKHEYIPNPTNAIEAPALNKATGGKLPGVGAIPIVAHGGELIIPKKNVDQGLAGIVDFAESQGLMFAEGGRVPTSRYQMMQARREKERAGRLSRRGYYFRKLNERRKERGLEPIERDINALDPIDPTLTPEQRIKMMQRGLLPNNRKPRKPRTMEERRAYERERRLSRRRYYLDKIEKRKQEIADKINAEREALGQDLLDPDDIAAQQNAAVPIAVAPGGAMREYKSGVTQMPDWMKEIRERSLRRNKEIDERISDPSGFRSPLLTYRKDYYDKRYGTYGLGGFEARQAMGLYVNSSKVFRGFAEGGKLNGDGPIPILAHGGELIIPKKNVDQGLAGILDFVEKYGLKYKEGGTVPEVNGKINSPMSGNTTINNVYNLTVLPGAFNMDSVIGEFNRVMESVVKVEVSKLRSEIDKMQYAPSKSPRFRKGIESA